MAISQKQILEGPIYKTLFALGWPVIVTSMLETFYSLVDTFWLGKLGIEESKNAVAALQISWPIIFFLISVGIGFGVAGIALVSQYTGAKNRKEAAKSAGQVLSLSLIFGFFVGILGSLFSRQIVMLLGIEEGIASFATVYMRVIFLGIPFMFTDFAFAFILRAYGNPVLPMKVQGATVILNALLDPILIFGLFGFPRLSVLGAALATIFSQFVSATIGTYVLFSGMAGIKIEPAHVKPEREKMAQIIKIGIPASIGMSGEALGFVVLMFLIARLPHQAVVLAAYGVGNRLTDLAFIVINGLGAGISIILGHSLGADRIERGEEAAKKGMGLMFSILVLISLTLFIFRRLVMSFFIDSPEVVVEGSHFIRIFVFGLPFFGIFSAVEASFTGSGHNVPSMILGLSRLWLLRIPLVYVLAILFNMGSAGVWLGMGLSNIFGALLALAVFSTGIWKRKVIK